MSTHNFVSPVTESREPVPCETLATAHHSADPVTAVVVAGAGASHRVVTIGGGTREPGVPSYLKILNMLTHHVTHACTALQLFLNTIFISCLYSINEMILYLIGRVTGACNLEKIIQCWMLRVLIGRLHWILLITLVLILPLQIHDRENIILETVLIM